MANVIDGLHLTVDGKVKDSEVFSQFTLTHLLKTLVESLQMKLIWGPNFLEVAVEPEKLTGDKFTDEGGTSGFCMINKSHIAIHVWPLRKFFCMDICSCDRFDAEEALRIITRVLNVESVRTQTIIRVQEFESPLQKASLGPVNVLPVVVTGNMEQVKRIGKCVGCNWMGPLFGEDIQDACHRCLTDEKYGVTWVKLSRRIRVDKKFAAMAYSRFETDEKKLRFIEIHGLPEGCEAPRVAMNGNDSPTTPSNVVQFRRRLLLLESFVDGSQRLVRILLLQVESPRETT